MMVGVYGFLRHSAFTTKMIFALGGAEISHCAVSVCVVVVIRGNYVFTTRMISAL